MVKKDFEKCAPGPRQEESEDDATLVEAAKAPKEL